MADTKPIYQCEKCSKDFDPNGRLWAICEYCERELCTDCGDFSIEDNLCGECRRSIEQDEPDMRGHNTF